MTERNGHSLVLGSEQNACMLRDEENELRVAGMGRRSFRLRFNLGRPYQTTN